jgi:hypothetical protein
MLLSLPCLLPTDKHQLRARLLNPKRLLWSDFRTGLSPVALQLLQSLVVPNVCSLTVFTTKNQLRTAVKPQKMPGSASRQRLRAGTVSLSYTSVSKSVLVVNGALVPLAFITTMLQTQIPSSISSTKANSLDITMP